MNVFLELPAEIICDVVGKWLMLRDITRLDSAFCNVQQRPVLYGTVFQSPLCCLAEASAKLPRHMPAERLKWFVAKRIRTEVVHYSTNSDLGLWEEYLKLCGSNVKCAHFDDLLHESSIAPNLVAKYCPNLVSLVWLSSEVSEGLVNLLTSSVHLEHIRSSISMQFVGLKSVPATHHLHLKSLDMSCSNEMEEMILRMSAPRSVQKLHLFHVHLPDWSQFVNLRSLGSSSADENQILQIPQHCPLIVNLDLSHTEMTDDVVGRTVSALHQLRTLSVQFSSTVTNRALMAIAEHRKHTLEALYVNGCHRITDEGIHHVLRECKQLHTLSYNSLNRVDFSLMGNITTLLVGEPLYPSAWATMRHFCRKELRNLQYLHVHFDYNVSFFGVKGVINTICEFPKLRTFCANGLERAYYKEITSEVAYRRPMVRVTDRCDVSDWYNLFDMPI